MATLLSALLFLLLPLSLSAQSALPPTDTAKGITIVRPLPMLAETARAGDALLVRIPRPAPEIEFLGEASLLSPDGIVAKRSKAFALPGARSDACVFGIPMDAPAGVYTVELHGSRGGLPYVWSRPLTLLSREFLSEDIPLDTSLTSLRTDQSARRAEEARVYAEVLGSVDPEGVWLDGPFIRPVESERRTSLFGDKRRYLYATGGTSSSVHMGIDFAAPTGTPVIAAGKGRVVLAANRIVTGNTVILEHLPGVYTIYMHMSKLLVHPGEVVERGAALGLVGATGLATGPHLHWELRVGGEACDPESPAFGGLFPQEREDKSGQPPGRLDLRL